MPFKLAVPVTAILPGLEGLKLTVVVEPPPEVRLPLMFKLDPAFPLVIVPLFVTDPIVPLPLRVAPEETVMLEPARDPVMFKVPAVTEVAPEKEALLALSVNAAEFCLVSPPLPVKVPL